MDTHIAYLSRYLPTSSPEWDFSDGDYYNYAIKNLQRMFPDFENSWVLDYKIWRSEFAQPIAEKNYSKIIPGQNTPFENTFICNMAQIYPEDRGTNYAIKEGSEIATKISKSL